MITGGTSAMGLATAKLLLDQGARVLVTGSTKKTIDSALQELGKNAIVMSSDARVLTDIDALAARVKSEFGAVDFLFLCSSTLGTERSRRSSYRTTCGRSRSRSCLQS